VRQSAVVTPRTARCAERRRRSPGAEERALSGLVVAVPEAEPAVARHRQLLDASARLGAPAHVTVLFPFVPTAELDERTLARVGATVSAVPAFLYTFRRTDWFGDDVLWLAPDDPGPFRELTERAHAAFPDHPPFEGVYADVVPHLTVGHRHPRPVLEGAEREVLDHLPITRRAIDVVLLAQGGPGGRWTVWPRFPLGG
jgi:2'-5' RNA ligase